MLHGIILHPVLVALSSSTFDFHLTGSRFFGHETPNSDYDFMVKETNDIEPFLENLNFTEISYNAVRGNLKKSFEAGFKSNSGKHYNSFPLDKMTSKVYRYNFKDEYQQIDIQIVHDLTAKLAVQNFLREQFGATFRNTPKIARPKFWDNAYDLYKKGK